MKPTKRRGSKKKLYYRVIVDDENYGIATLDEARKFVFDSIEGTDDECNIVITKVFMTEKQFERLPEYD